MNTLFFLAFIIGGVAIPVLGLLGIFKKDKVHYKRAGIAAIVAVASFVGFIATADEPEETKAEEPEVEEVEEEPETEEVVEVESEEEVEAVAEEPEEVEEEPEEIPEREDIIATSDGNIDDADSFNIRDMRNDTTGNWRLATTSKKVDIKKYGKSYAEKYMSSSEVHVLVNFSTKTTTILNKSDGMLFATIHEYVDKEEHDANKAGTGMVLASYNIFLDNGDVQDAM